MDKYTATEQAYKHGYEKGCAAGKPKWIPVSEQLPDIWKNVLVCRKDGQIIMDWLTPQLEWYRGHQSLATHWMPLPEPPKE